MMGKLEDPCEIPVVDETTSDFSTLVHRPPDMAETSVVPMALAAATGFLHGFDIEGQPLVCGLAQLPGEVVAARTTVALKRRMVGEAAIVLFDQGDPRRPIIVGVVQPGVPQAEAAEDPSGLAIQADGERYVVSAEREIVLRCGDASITLTRAGKVIIKGNYILSRSTGYNKIKGAAIDIN
jgi:hypothetical protein